MSPDPKGIDGAGRLGEVVSGRYRIERLLGEGGMGAVYLAEHTHMKKRVALKLLHKEMSENQEVLARFEREAMTAAHIDHPNVAAATDFGRTDDGGFFLVLEYVEGTSLRDAMGQSAMAPLRVVRIAKQIALALEKAHEAKIVHRDLKPENVMLVPRGDDPDFVKVLDFGIAKIAVDSAVARGDGRQPLTCMGTILGTPEYMAPEQALGEEVTPRADLYALGVMLYEMLTGLHPFDPPDRTAMLSFHMVAPVPPMRERAPNVDVPPALEAVVRRLLEKDKLARPESARALIHALDEAVTQAGMDANPSRPTPPPPTSLGARDFGPVASMKTLQAGSIEAADSAPERTSVLDTLREQKRHVFLAIATALPLGFIVVVVGVLFAMRGGKHADAPAADGGSEPGLIAKVLAAPKPDAARVAQAKKDGPDALAALQNEFPKDVEVAKLLVVSYHQHGRDLDAVRALKALDKDSLSTPEMEQVLTDIAASGQGEAPDEAFALLEGSLGARGVDLLVELTGKTNAPALRARANKALSKTDVRSHASEAADVLLDFKDANSCTKKRDLLSRVRDKGDGRVLPLLKPLKLARGCGFLGTRDCWSCMRKDDTLDGAIEAVETRARTEKGGG